MTENRQWLINGNPRGRAIAASDFERTTVPLAALQAGQVRIKTRYLGFDPSQKGQMENIGGYSAPTRVGDVMRARGIGEVVESNDPRVEVGSKVAGNLGWQDYASLPGDQLEVLPDDGLLTAHLGPLGGTGLTAYFGLLRKGRPEPGDTVVVSGAAGAVGSMVGQIARLMGCRTIGIAGGPEKCRWLTEEVGYEAAIDYKTESVKQAAAQSPVSRRLERLLRQRGWARAE